MFLFLILFGLSDFIELKKLSFKKLTPFCLFIVSFSKFIVNFRYGLLTKHLYPPEDFF